MPGIEPAPGPAPYALTGTARACSGAVRVQERLNERPVARAAEAREVSAVHHAYRKREQALHAEDVVVDRRMPGVGHERPVVDGVARKEHPARRLPERDRARRVPGGVEDFKVAVAEVEDVAIVDEPGRGCGQDVVGALVESRPEEGR